MSISPVEGGEVGKKRREEDVNGVGGQFKSRELGGVDCNILAVEAGSSCLSHPSAPSDIRWSCFRVTQGKESPRVREGDVLISAVEGGAVGKKCREGDVIGGTAGRRFGSRGI